MNLQEGELICDKCNGTGQSIEELTETSKKWTWCSKCYGSGKVDWIDNIMGRRPLTSSSGSSGRSGSSISSSSVMKEMSKHLADEIDKEILECILGKAEQTNKIMNLAKIMLYEIGGQSP